MREELVMNKVRDVAELYILADRCARAEEGRKYPGEDAGAETDSTDEDTAAPTKKGRRRNRKRKGKAMLAVEASDSTGATKKAKADDPDKEIAGCAACRPWRLPTSQGAPTSSTARSTAPRATTSRTAGKSWPLVRSKKPSMRGGIKSKG